MGDKAGPLSELTFCSRRIKPLAGDDLCWCLSGSLEGGGTCGEVKNWVAQVQVLNEQEMGMAGTFPRFSLSLGTHQALCCAFLHVFNNNWEQTLRIACLQLILTQAFRNTALGPSAPCLSETLRTNFIMPRKLLFLAF